MTAAAHSETLGFQTETRQILHLMINALYSNKEVFLRELISNASDACDKLRFEALKDSALLAGGGDPEIRVSVDEEAGTVTVSDNGIGMSRQEVIDNLGTIARSGTASFLEALKGEQKKDAHLIGQFGVGFYSSFIVADKVIVETRRADLKADEAVRWSCAGEDEYTIEPIEKDEPGTTITLHLRDEDKEFANNWRLRSIIKKYSDHIAVPIRMPKVGEQEEGEPEWETVNDATALWTRPRSEISDDDYKAFYQHIAHDFREPLAWSHNHVEGKQEYTSLLYIPSEPPFDLYQREAPRGLKLYIQRVFIMDDAEQFLPLYLRFVKGVIDSNDLPLNVSRETLQSNSLVDSIRSAVTKRVLDMLETMARDKPEDYSKFWHNFGAVLKEGMAEDFTNRDRIAGLLRFTSTHDESTEQRVSLKDYVGRMGEGQDKIYYLIADGHAAAINSPYLEVFRKKGIEVLLLTDRIDEWLMSHLQEFDGKPLQDVAKGELDLGDLDDDKDKSEEDKKSPEAESLVAKVKEVLGDKVADVRVSRRLTDSPACLVVGEQELGVQMRRILEAAGQSMPETRPTLELNPDHPLMAKVEAADGENSNDLVWLIYEQAVLASGDHLDNPAAFVRRLNSLLLAEAS